MNVQGTGLRIKHDEVISVGKYWLWMTVFSTCLFTSCGETNRHTPESTSPAPKTQAVPARYDREVIPPHEGVERNDLNPEQFEEFPDSEFDEFDEFDDFDLERFDDEDVQPNEYEEIRESEPEEEIREVQARPDSHRNHPDLETQLALRETPISLDRTDQKSSPPMSPPSPAKAAATLDPEAKWLAQFQVTGDPDDFEPDSPDDFE